MQYFHSRFHQTNSWTINGVYSRNEMIGKLESHKKKIKERNEIFIAWVIGSPTTKNSSVLRCWYNQNQLPPGHCKTH